MSSTSQSLEQTHEARRARPSVLLIVGPSGGDQSRALVSAIPSDQVLLIVSDNRVGRCSIAPRLRLAGSGPTGFNGASPQTQVIKPHELPTALCSQLEADVVFVDHLLSGYSRERGCAPVFDWLARLALRADAKVVASVPVDDAADQVAWLLALDNWLGPANAATVERLDSSLPPVLLVSFDAPLKAEVLGGDHVSDGGLLP